MTKLIDLAYISIHCPDDMPDRYHLAVHRATQRGNGQWRYRLGEEELFFVAETYEGVAVVGKWWVQPVAAGARERRREKRKDLQR